MALRQLQIWPIESFACHLEKMCRQNRDVFFPFAQRLYVDREDAQPVVEILPESSVADCGLQVVLTGRDHAEVGASRFLVANRLELTFLEDAEQLRLHLRRQVSHFVEKQRTAIGELKAADPIPERSAEGPFDVAKKFAFKQLPGNRGRVHFD